MASTNRRAPSGGYGSAPCARGRPGRGVDVAPRLGVHAGRAIAIARERQRDIAESVHRSLERDACAAFDLDPRTDEALATAIEPHSFTDPVQAPVPEVIAPDGQLPETGDAKRRPEPVESAPAKTIA